MAAARERSERPYEEGEGFGKFRKRPFRRIAHTTPYDRPPTAFRSASHGGASSSNGWLAKLVDPAQRLITSSAHKLFASVFRKRLPPPPPPQPPAPEVNQRTIHKQLEAVPAERLGSQATVVDRCDKPSNSSGRCGVTELEQILKQKTFTRSEIDWLTALLQSRSIDPHDGEEEKRSEVLPSQAVISQNRKEMFSNTPVKNYGTENCFISTPAVNSNVLDEDIASPAELAKAYMGSRPSKVSPSTLGVHSQPLRENSTALIIHPFASKSPIMSVVPKSTGHTGFPENGFVTPRSRGRSAIYNMARTPYARVHSTATIQGTGTTIDAFGGPSSSSKSLRENNRFSESKQGIQALKRRSCVLDNDIGSVGPIRRIRQKSNLLPASGSLSIRGAFGSATARYPSLTEKATLVGEPSKENGDNGIHVLGSTPVHSKSSEMASKILQQLDVLVSSREKSPAKLSPSMLSGQALRSMENIDSPKFLENVHDNNKLDVKQDTTLADARDSITQKQDKAEENGPTKAIATYVKSPSAINDVNTTSLEKKIVTGVEPISFSVTNSIELSPPQKKRSFQMSAHEDYLELDDDDHPNGTTSTAFTEESGKLDTPLLENKNSAVEAITVEKPPGISEANKPLSSTHNKKREGADVLVVPEKSGGFAFPAAPLPSLTIQQAVVDSNSTAVIDKAGLLKESNTASPIFSFGERAVSAKESNGASPTSNLSFKTSKVPQFMFTTSSSVLNDSSGIKFSALSDPKPESLSSSLNNGSLASTPSSFSPSSSSLFSNNFTGQISSGSSTNTVASSTNNSFGASGPATNTGATSSLAMSASPSSFTAAPIFKFASSVVPSTSASSVMAPTSLESTETKTKEAGLVNLTSVPFGGNSSSISSSGSSLFGGTTSALASTESNKFDGMSSALTSTTGSNIFGAMSSAIACNGSTIFGGTSSAATSTGSGFFSLNTGATTSSATNQSQGFNPFSTGSAQTSAAALATSTQSIPIQFGGSSSSPSFGLSGNTALSSGSSLFSSTSTAKLFSSGSTFGSSSASSSSEPSSISSSSSTTTTVFGSNWQAPKSSIFGSTFNSSASSSTGFAFGALSTSSAATNSTPMVFGSSTSGAPSSGSIFPFSSPAVAAPSLPLFGNPNPSFAFGSSPASNNDQMTMEDSMAEDTVQAGTPTVPGFGQQPMPSAFVFGSAVPSGVNQFGSPAPTGANPFQFGSQSNITAPQIPSPFQASGSLEFNAGGSFSLGTGGNDKSSRKFVKVRKTQRKK